MKKESDFLQKFLLVIKFVELRFFILDRKVVFENFFFFILFFIVFVWKVNLLLKRGFVIKDKEVKIEIIEKDKVFVKVEEQVRILDGVIY